MPCLKLPPIELPEFPEGVGFGAALAPISFDAELCCKKAAFPYATPPIALGVGVQIPPPILVIVAKARAAVIALSRKLEVKCPRE